MLQQLKIEARPSYDVTPEQAAKAELHLVCSLSSLARAWSISRTKCCRRCAFPFTTIWTAKCKYGSDAAAQGGRRRTRTVKVWTEGPTLLRRFLSPDEGGADKGWPAPAIRWPQLTGFTRPDDPTVTSRCSVSGCSSWSWRRGT